MAIKHVCITPTLFFEDISFFHIVEGEVDVYR